MSEESIDELWARVGPLETRVLRLELTLSDMRRPSPPEPTKIRDRSSMREETKSESRAREHVEDLYEAQTHFDDPESH